MLDKQAKTSSDAERAFLDKRKMIKEMVLDRGRLR